jgi:hypothetical protein
MIRRILLPGYCLLVVLLTGVPSVCLGLDTSNPEQLGQHATELQLAEHPAWLALLHYKRESLLPRVLSQADDDDFFLAKLGKTDPQAELLADLAAMLLPSAIGHAQCRFPARWHWLKQQLDIRGADVPCPKLDLWLGNIEASSLSLVFPAMYLNNPGSAFGHTFLRFNHPQSDLLSHTLNYAAEAEMKDGVMRYVYNGLFGGYRGVFMTRRYYRTVQTYSHIENRDIWEYRLDLNPEEIVQLQRHVWEVIGIDFDYFFFRENCSYRLLALLDVVRPEAQLSSFETFSLYAIPVDTVRALENAGMIEDKVYRPSLVSQIEQGFASQTDAFDQAVVALADAELTIDQALAVSNDAATRAVLLDTAHRVMQFRDQQATPLAQSILARRSQMIGVNSEQTPEAIAPEQGHQSARFSITAGRLESNPYYELEIKSAFHELLDSPRGYVEGAEINVLDTRLRWLPKSDALKLQSLRFYNVMSLSPWQSWYRPLSWQLDIKLHRQFIDAQTSDLIFSTRTGAGISRRALGATWFGMLTLDAEASDNYAKGYSTLAGLQLGLSGAFPGGQLLLSAEHNNAFAGFDFERDRLAAGIQFNLTPQSAVRVQYEKTVYENFEITDWRAAVHWYY